MSKSFKNISVVAAATTVSRFLGLGREALISAVFGLGALASTFYAAFTLPNLFRRLLGEGALTAALVPALSDELRDKGREGAFSLVNNVASWLFVVSGGVVVLSMGGILLAAGNTGFAVSLGVKADSIERWLAAADFAVVLFPYLIFVSLAAAFSAALQTLNRFLEPALSPIWLNLAMIGLLGFAAYGGGAPDHAGQMVWLCSGALLGGFLQMAVPALALTREGWRPHFTLTLSAPLRHIMQLMVPTLFGSAIYLINMAVSRLVGLSLNESAGAALTLATRLMELPIGIFTVAISTVIFPLIAKHASARDWVSMANSYRKGMRLILVINIPAAVGLSLLATPIVRVLFQRGDFKAEDTALLGPVVVASALGLPFISFASLVLRAFYAQKDTTTPVHAALLSFFVNLGLSFALMGPFGTVGLAAASNVAVVAQAMYLQTKLARTRDGLGFRPLVGDLAKVVLAAAWMGGAVAGGWWQWQRMFTATFLTDVAALVVLIGGGVAVYAGSAWLLRIEGREELTAIFSKVRRKLGGGAAR